MEVFIVIYLVSLLPALGVVELALKRWLSSEPISIKKIFWRSLIRGILYSPAAIGAGHGGGFLSAFMVLVLSPFAESVDFSYGIPALILTCIIFIISFIARNKKKKKEPNQSLQTTTMAVTDAAAQPPRQP
jgi:glucose uptake protein GlcU